MRYIVFSSNFSIAYLPLTSYASLYISHLLDDGCLIKDFHQMPWELEKFFSPL
jgi:hypothetical protein